MKHLLIAASTIEELLPLIRQYNGTSAHGNRLYEMKVGNKAFDILATGVGSAATAYWLGKQFAKEKYEFAIQAGVAGSFSDSLKVGDVVNVTRDAFADLGAEDDENFLTLSQLGLRILDDHIFRGEWMVNDSVVPPFLHRLKQASSITVNKAHGNERSIRKIFDLYQPDIESMEGAAFFYACLHEQVPFMQVRSVSNTVEKRNRSAWDIPKAIETLNLTLLQFLESIK